MSLSDLVYLLPFCLITLAIIGLFWVIFAYFMFRTVDRNLRRCPNCKRGAVGIITDTEIESLGIKVDRGKLTPVRIKREKVTDHYQCEHCGHNWTRSFERREQLPVQKTPTG